MVCKCGAVVKASAHRPKSPELGVYMGQKSICGPDIGPLQGGMPVRGRPGLEPQRFGRFQELGTIEARSKEVTTPRGDA